MKKALCISIMLILSISFISCNGEYKDYMDKFRGYKDTIGDLTNDESLEDLVTIYGDETATDINVLPVELDDDFIMGVDISSIIEVEEAGGVFYNDSGQEQDVFEILKAHGVNYVRIRLWYDPYNEDGEAFGGGTNDTETGIAIAKRAARVGMRICLDFHYSDFWADPSKQKMPRAWEDLGKEELKQAIYDYTYETIKAFEEEGVRPHMVQVGNEINNGMVYSKGKLSIYGFDDLAEYISSGINAVKAVSEDIKTVVHLAQGASESSLKYFYNNIIENGVEFDVIGLSYYAYWHGKMDQFQSTLEALDETYEQEIAVMEYAYGYTDYSNEYTSNIYSSDLEDNGGYDTSMQGQASYIRDVNAAVASIESGIGTFYWEPAWLGIDGTGWSSQGAYEYLLAQNDAVGIGTVSWANQALFSFSGKALPSLDVFNLMKTSTFDEEEIISIEDELSVTINLGADETLPPTTTAYTSLGRFTQVEITWNQAQLDTMTEAGDYVITGTVISAGNQIEVTCYVEAFINYILNASFEEGGRVGSDVKDFNDVASWNVTQDVYGAVKVESKNPRTEDNQGVNNLNIWASTAYSFTLYQTVILPAGTYELSVWTRSSDTVPVVSLFVADGQTNIASQTIIYGSSWSQWVKNTLTFTLTEETTLTVGLTGDCAAASWAHFDDFALKEVE